MDAASGLSFGYPWLLLGAMTAIVAIPALVAHERRKRRLADRFATERLRDRPMRARALRPWLIALAAAAFFCALAAPFYGTTERPVAVSGTRTVLAIDLSDSMNARDLGVTRLQLAKSLASHLLSESDGRFGLVVFEGVAEIVSPLTTDLDALSTLIDSLSTGELPTAGSNLEAAIDAARELLRTGRGSGRILLIGDGEETAGNWRAAAARVAGYGIHIDTVLIGSEEGAEILLESGAPLRDENREIVVTRARPEIFQEIAAATGGRYLSNPASVASLVVAGEARSDRERRSEQVPNERYQWPLAFAFFLATLASVVNRGAE